MRSTDFFKNMLAFESFTKVVNMENYKPAPEDWMVIITDVIGSTKAIEAGNYRDVNIIGASSLIAVLNSVSRIDIPYVFGGDGATLLVPVEFRELVEDALRASKTLARKEFDLDLRIGIVPVSTIRKLGGEILVAKYKVGPTAHLATFLGGGLSLAEKLVKSDERYRVSYNDEVATGNFLGLQCRWDAFSSSHGEILSVIVSATDNSRREDTYKRALEMIDDVMGSFYCPIRTTDLRDQIKNKTFRFGKPEVRVLGHRKSLLEKLKVQAAVLFEMLAFKYMQAKGLKGKEFDPEKYTTEVAQATDSRKFDDVLRLVLDCSQGQKEKIESWLHKEYVNGNLGYGIHASRQALMTCLIFNFKNHVHLVDGCSGGYAMAAKKLKAQNSLNLQASKSAS